MLIIAKQNHIIVWVNLNDNKKSKITDIAYNYLRIMKLWGFLASSSMQNVNYELKVV